MLLSRCDVDDTREWADSDQDSDEAIAPHRDNHDAAGVLASKRSWGRMLDLGGCLRLQSQDQHKVDGGCPSGRGMCKQCRKLAASVLMQAETFSTLLMGRHLVLGEMCRGLSFGRAKSIILGQCIQNLKGRGRKGVQMGSPREE